MKVRVTSAEAHDTTVDKVYETVDAPSWSRGTLDDAVWIVDDVSEVYILFGEEYEVVSE